MNKKLYLAAFAVALGVACTPAAAAYDGQFLRSATAFRTPETFSLNPEGADSARALCRRPLQQWSDLGRRSVANAGPWPDEAISNYNDGTNYAFGGAQTGPTDIDPFDPNSPVHIDLPDQITAFNLVAPRTQSKARSIRSTLARMTSWNAARGDTSTGSSLLTEFRRLSPRRRPTPSTRSSP